MNIIRQSCEIWEQSYPNNDIMRGIWEHIERCVRVCYQSTDKQNNKETAEEFVRRTILPHQPENDIANHLAMLEHGTVYLSIPFDEWDTTEDIAYLDNPYSQVNLNCIDINHKSGNVYITTNLRVLIENDWLEDLKYLTIPTKYHEPRITICFNTNIGVSRELNRHRVHSISEESTRYCNYNKDKFENQLSIVHPVWLDNPDSRLSLKEVISAFNYADGLSTSKTEYARMARLFDDVYFYNFALLACEYSYNCLIEKGWTPQQAREVLPLATKTQLVHTAFLSDWKYFLKLRKDGVSGAPHPNMKALAEELNTHLIELGYI